MNAMPPAERPFRILVIEDNATDAGLIKEALSASAVEHEMLVLEDGLKALEHLKQLDDKKPDLIILDLNMPKHDGLEVLIQYRMNVALFAVPIIVLTSSDAPSDKLRAKTIGVSAFIRKPLKLEDFIALGKQFKVILETPYVYTGPHQS
jgi:CheY-like chemotaxis protein